MSTRHLIFAAAVSTSVVTLNDVLGQTERPLREWTVQGSGGNQKLNAASLRMAKGQVTLVQADGGAQTVALQSLPEDERKAALIDVVGSGVVVVHVKDIFNELAGVGSGFVFRKDGLILTNYHVVRGAGAIDVKFRDHINEPKRAYCLAVDRDNDVAILKVDHIPDGVHVLELAPRAVLKQGDAVWTIGHPNQLANTISWGEVNAVRKTSDLPDDLQEVLQFDETTAWIQTDAVIDQGSSGGPLLNTLGQVIGINTFLLGPQFGFALQVAHARGAFEQATFAKPMALPFEPGPGESALAWIISREVGAVIRAFDEEMQSQLPAGLPQAQSVKRAAFIQTRYRRKLQEIARAKPRGWPAFQASYFLCRIMCDESVEADRSRK